VAGLRAMVCLRFEKGVRGMRMNEKEASELHVHVSTVVLTFLLSDQVQLNLMDLASAIPASQSKKIQGLFESSSFLWDW
jgi:hypothetical protein